MRTLDIGKRYQCVHAESSNFFLEAIHEFPQDMNKALELRNRASELGDAESYNNLGSAYFSGGDGLQVDIDELSAMKGVMYQEDTGWAWHSKNH